ncbi:MAG: helix-hairpin-helix domain-containing protein [Tannerellaceae bacterium]|nr:helix-hairpin-helix domain-containing protein [Tannerellaceae bacterium]MCD8263153.1 helix-hairpin-helix domain-containing protein [Tannerellaceae bacterium]
MKWHDLLYFSKGERRALLLLLCLITTAFILLILSDRKEEYQQQFIICEKCRQIHPASENSLPATEATGNILLKTAPVQHNNHRKKQSQYVTKYPPGTIIELNSADTSQLKRIPGIGSAFANRIVKYRELLGGFYHITQLGEVYGITPERYEELKNWFSIDTVSIRPLPVNHLPADSLLRHPYLSPQQARTIITLRKQKGNISGWSNLRLLEEFPQTDIERLSPYISFE